MSEKYIPMEEVTENDLIPEDAQRGHNRKYKNKNRAEKKIKQYQPEQFELERLDAWSFPERGKWATNPPYANIVAYSNRKNQVSGDLSFSRSLTGYLEGMREIAKESYRVLRPGRFCAILVGDARRHRHRVPIAFRVMQFS